MGLARYPLRPHSEQWLGSVMRPELHVVCAALFALLTREAQALCPEAGKLGSQFIVLAFELGRVLGEFPQPSNDLFALVWKHEGGNPFRAGMCQGRWCSQGGYYLGFAKEGEGAPLLMEPK